MIGVGLIGWGYWGPNLGRNIAATEGCRLATIADSSEAQLSLAASSCPGVHLTRSAESLLADPTVSAVVIATPASTHFALALAALRAGKHVLVEKPLTRTSREALTLIEESERRGLALMVDHTFLFSPAVSAIRDLLASGTLGTLRSYESARLNRGLVRDDVSVLWDVASHDLSLLDVFAPTAPIGVRAESTTSRPGHLAHDAQLTLTYPGGFTARVAASWTTPVKTRRVAIVGSHRRLVYDDMAETRKVTVYEGDEPVSAPDLDTTEPLGLVVEHFIRCIAEGKRPLTDGPSGLRVVRQLEAAEQSLAHGVIVALDGEGIPA